MENYAQRAISMAAQSVVDSQKFSYYDFATSKGFLGKKLYPVQSIFLKLIDGRPLDDQVKFDIHDEQDNVQYSVTEKEFLHICHEEGRSSWDSQKESQGKFIGLFGRRSGKSFIDSIILSASPYKFLHIQDPYQKYHIDKTTPLRIACISASEDQAMFIFDGAKSNMKDTVLYDLYKRHYYTEEIHLWHPSYQGDDDMPLIVKPFAAASSTIRGPAYFTAIFDEFGHFQHERGKSSAKELYKALRPAVGTFSNDGLLLLSSSAPHDNSWASEFVDEQYKNKDSEYLVLKLPTWWVNRAPDIIRDVKSAFKENRDDALSEYDTRYAVRGETWIDQSYINRAQERRSPSPTRKSFFFAGFDIGGADSKDCATVIAPTDEGILEVVEHISLSPGEGEFTNIPVIPPAYFAQKIEALYSKYSIILAICDQFEKLSFGTLLPPQILSTWQAISFNGMYKSITAMLFEQVIKSESLYIPSTINSILVEDLATLTAYYSSGQLVVSHTDDGDALQRAVLAAFIYSKLNPSRYQFGSHISIFDPMHALGLDSMMTQTDRIDQLSVASTALGLTTGFQSQHTQDPALQKKDYSSFFSRARNVFSLQSGPHDIQRRN